MGGIRTGRIRRNQRGDEHPSGKQARLQFAFLTRLTKVVQPICNLSVAFTVSCTARIFSSSLSSVIESVRFNSSFVSLSILRIFLKSVTREDCSILLANICQEYEVIVSCEGAFEFTDYLAIIAAYPEVDKSFCKGLRVVATIS